MGYFSNVNGEDSPLIHNLVTFSPRFNGAISCKKSRNQGSTGQIQADDHLRNIHHIIIVIFFSLELHRGKNFCFASFVFVGY